MKKLVTVILIIAFFALIYYCISYIQAPVSTISALSATREEIVTGDAYIVRNETVYSTTASGTIYSYVREGARVGKSRKICAIYDSDTDRSDMMELMTINEKILSLSSAVVDGNNYTSLDGSKEERLLQIYERIEEAAVDNDIETIAECKAEIALILNGTEAVSTADKIAELTRQKAEIEARIKSPKDVLYAQHGSGIYSTNIDGYESILNSNTVSAMTVEKFNQIAPVENTETKKVCKIINNHEWYVMALVNRSEIKNIKIGDEVGVRFSKLPGEQTTATVSSISEDGAGEEKAVLVLKCESYSEGAFSIRTSGVEIIRKSYTGFEVPVHAIRVRDGQSGVSVRTGGDDIFKPCRIIYKDEVQGIAIIVADTEDINRQLRQYDVIIAGEK